MGLLLRLLLVLAASLALPASASLPATSSSTPETASGVSAASVAEGHGELGAWVHNTCEKITVGALRRARPTHALDPPKSDALAKLSDDELLRAFNNPSGGPGDMVSLNDIDGIAQGHHRINEILSRVGKPGSTITDETTVTIDRYVRDLSAFWDLE